MDDVSTESAILVDWKFHWPRAAHHARKERVATVCEKTIGHHAGRQGLLLPLPHLCYVPTLPTDDFQLVQSVFDALQPISESDLRRDLEDAKG